MQGIHRVRIGARTRVIALFQSFLLVATTSCVPPFAMSPEPGVLEYRRPLLLELPGGRANVGGGNLLIPRIDLTLDTLFGTLEVGATYNSASRRWLWPFEMTYDGETFEDSSGAVHDLSSLADGDAIPGTHWVKVDAGKVKTKGGLVYHFGAFNHRLVALTGTDGMRPALVFFSAHIAGSVRTTTVSQCRFVNYCQLVYAIEYDDHGCVAGIEDRAGRRAIFENDEECRPQRARDPLDVAQGWPGRRYEYAEGLLTSITNSEGERIEYGYASGRLARVQRMGAGESAMEFRYGFEPRSETFFTVVEDARGGRSVYRYDADQRLLEFRDSDGDLTGMAWSGRRPASRTAPDGATTAWLFQDDDPVRVELPSGNIVLYEYDPDAQNRTRPFERPIARVVDSLGLVESRTYDARGHLLSATNGEGEVRWLWHDEEGNLSVVVEPSGEETWFYDHGEHGHPARILSGGSYSYRTYDPVGNLLQGPDASGMLSPGRPGIHRRNFDEDRNISSVELVGESAAHPPSPETGELRTLYRSDGRMARILRPYGGDTIFEYDAAGRLVERRERVDGVWQGQIYEYSPAGDLSAVELANGMRSEVSHDEMGRPIRLAYSRRGILEKEIELIWRFGRVESLSDSRRPGLESLAYDFAGRVVSVHFPEGEMIERQYDLRSQEISRIFRLNGNAGVLRNLGFTYDLAGRQIEVHDQGQLILDRRFEDGRLGRIIHGNGLVRSFEYEPVMGLLERTDLHEFAGETIVSTEMTWSECGGTNYCLVANARVYGHAGEELAGIHAEESYEMGPRLEFLSTPEGYGARLESWYSWALGGEVVDRMGHHAFDVLGNWLGVQNAGASTLRFEYNSERNRLLGSDGQVHHDYAWDESGFMVQYDEAALEWDAAGLLTRIGDSISLEWDGLGRPISVTTPEGTREMLFGGTVVGDASRQPISLDLGDVQVRFASNERIYRHEDFRGNVQMVTDDGGRLVKFYTYSPFGVAETFGSESDARNFAQGQTLGAFLVLGKRVYDPQAGRFISPDPVYHVLNQFSYTLGNPIAFWDPGGESAEPSPLAKGSRMAQQAAKTMAGVGSAVLDTGLNLGSVPLILLGAGIIVFAAASALVVIYCFKSLAQGKVTIEDLPGGYAGEGDGGGGSGEGGAIPGIAACSPLAASAPGSETWPVALLLPSQFLLAALFLGWMRRTRRAVKAGGD